MNPDKPLAIDAFKLINEMVGDLSVASRLPELMNLEIFRRLFEGSPVFVGRIRKFSDIIMIITLAKFLEWDKAFSKLLSDEGRSISRELTGHINRKKIKALRNKVVAHVTGKEAKVPLTDQEKETLFRESGFESVESFGEWVQKNCIPTLELIRTSISQKYTLDEDQIFAEENKEQTEDKLEQK